MCTYIGTTDGTELNREPYVALKVQLTDKVVMNSVIHKELLIYLPVLP